MLDSEAVPAGVPSEASRAFRDMLFCGARGAEMGRASLAQCWPSIPRLFRITVHERVLTASAALNTLRSKRAVNSGRSFTGPIANQKF
jgi:hypothetical protein